MKIAVIGTGNVGSALGGSLARAGHDVTFAARDAAKAAEVAQAAGGTSPRIPPRRGTAPTSSSSPCRSRRSPRSPPSSRPVIAGKVVIDPTNPLTPDYSGLDHRRRPVRRGARSPTLLPGANVVKAFNTLFATVQADPGALGTTVDAPDRHRRRRARPRRSPRSPRRSASARSTSARWPPPASSRRSRSSTSGSSSSPAARWQTSVVLVAPPEAALAA